MVGVFSEDWLPHEYYSYAGNLCWAVGILNRSKQVSLLFTAQENIKQADLDQIFSESKF